MRNASTGRLWLASFVIGFCFAMWWVADGRAASVGPESAPPEAFAAQYHERANPVSLAVFPAVSVANSRLDHALYLVTESSLERATDRPPPPDRQYHEDPRVQLALGLGGVYLVFLACWLWATRVRPRRR